MKHEKKRLTLRWIKSVAMAAIMSNPALAAAECVEVLSPPKRVLIEETETAQRLNLDFYIENRSCAKLELQSIQLSVYDRQGRLGFRRDVDGSGGAPAIEVMGPDREFAPGAKGLTFNPFDGSVNSNRYSRRLSSRSRRTAMQGAASRAPQADGLNLVVYTERLGSSDVLRAVDPRGDLDVSIS